MDGERRMAMRDEALKTKGFNKKGQEVPLPGSVIKSINDQCTIDGEIIGEVLHIFDILEYAGETTKGMACMLRLALLDKMKFGKSIKVVKTAYTKKEKQKLYDEIKKRNGEGIVFKKKDSPYTHGRPASGGNQVKYKLYKTATFIVKGATVGKRSVGLELVGENMEKVFMGKVTIPPNYEVPDEGDLVEVRYLYAYLNGAVFQPTYLGKRNDSDLTDATMKQIVYKNEVE